MTKVKSVPFSQVKQKLLNTPEAVKGYEDADKELEMVEMLYEMPRYGTPVYHSAATQHAFERVTTQELFHHLCIAHIRHRFWHTLCAGITVLSLNL